MFNHFKGDNSIIGFAFYLGVISVKMEEINFRRAVRRLKDSFA